MSKSNATGKRRNKPMSAAGLLDPVLRRAMRQRGFTKAEVIVRWPEIVGPSLAQATMPVALHFPRGKRRDGTLVVRTESAFAPELAHRQDMLIERINRFYGFRAVARLAIDQGPVAFAPARQSQKASKLEPGQKQRLDAAIGKTRDRQLKDALAKLGARVLGQGKSQ